MPTKNKFSEDCKLFDTAEELTKPELAQIKGVIPKWLKGRFLRVGPSKFDFPDEFKVNHFVDGYAMLSSFEISPEGWVKFNKKYLQSDAYKRSLAAKKPVINEFATRAYPDPNKGLFSRMVTGMIPEYTDNNYASIFTIGKEVFAISDTCFFHNIDPVTLKTGAKLDSNKLFGINGQSAHPLQDPETGDIYNYGYSLFPSVKHCFVKFPPPPTKGLSSWSKKGKTVGTIPSRWNSALAALHSFGMTKNYLVMIEQPCTVGLAQVLSSLVQHDTLKDWATWRPNEPNKFCLLDKKTGKQFATEFISKTPFYFMHIVNCFEHNDELIVDIITYPSIAVMDIMMLENLRDGTACDQSSQSRLQRFVLPLMKYENAPKDENLVTLPNSKAIAKKSDKNNQVIVEGETLSQIGIELFTINKKFEGSNLKYLYGIGFIEDNAFRNSVCKIDVHEKKVVQKWWDKDGNHFPGEPVFVGNPNATREDDGVIISAVVDKRKHGKDFLLFLEATTLKEIARAEFNCGVPIAIHGLFLDF